MKICGLVLLFWCSTSLAFDEVKVTPSDPQGWQAVNVRDDAMVEHSQNQPLFGDGSLLFATDTMTPGQDKADYQYLWQESTSVIDFPDRILGNITHLNYAWYRDSASTTAPHLTPVFRLNFYDDAGTVGNLADDVLGILVWEGVYNGYNPPLSDSWEIVNMMEDNFWVFVSQSAQGSGVIQNFNATLADWINGTPQGQPGDPQITLTANTYIIGVNVGVGSGWNNSFLGYVDAVRVGFGSGDDTLYNFEVCQELSVNNDPDLLFQGNFECFQ
ncbi:hypothetical protein [Marinicella meishanensis]|uniref:hypothetical protein n=1 Tax=Marinicella meishanensis TaxID=2873263 RepID=UPI001CBC09FF|nr:hypothetical protein [Marinicella sp. NBU2979]